MKSPATTHSLVLLYSTLIVVLSLSVINSDAQLCNGSLGDPVVNITFGPGGSSTPFSPTGAYGYTYSTCPNDGYYTITRSTSGCFDDHWHTVTSDHTGNGNFMLINAARDSGDFFLATVTDLCPNTNYQFSAWIMNVLKAIGIHPRILFSIEAADGTLLGSYYTGEIQQSSVPTWTQYGFYFTTPADNAEIILRMTNNADGGDGNDLALDDITFSPCGPSITVAIQGNKDTVDICEGNNSQYTLAARVSSGYLIPVYQWQESTDGGASWEDIEGANSAIYQRMPTGAGFYRYRLTVIDQSVSGITACRIASNYVAVNVHANPIVDAGPDRFIIAGHPVIMAATVTGEPADYAWRPPDYLDNNTLLTPLASPPADINYTLLATTQYGCKNQDDVQVKVVAGIFVPNAFTPNGDGRNDHWRVPFIDPLLQATVNVYSRWGQLVYHAEDKTVDWDGTIRGFPQPSGIYVYSITFKTAYPAMKGTVLLIR